MKTKKLFALLLLLGIISFASCGSDGEKGKEVIFYEAGDLYQSGSEKAVIYKVVTISGGMYALAVSLDEAELEWSTENVKTGAEDLENGYKNQQTIQRISNWGKKYPAFKWCADKNSAGENNWYLPSTNEMEEIYYMNLEDKQTGKTISLSDHIKKLGGTPFDASSGIIPPYWTSTESSDDAAATIRYGQYEGISLMKNKKYKVRAVKYVHIY